MSFNPKALGEKLKKMSGTQHTIQGFRLERCKKKNIMSFVLFCFAALCEWVLIWKNECKLVAESWLNEFRQQSKRYLCCCCLVSRSYRWGSSSSDSREQQLLYLYLANDVVQNSKKKGSA
jgi:hypothetical protein